MKSANKFIKKPETLIFNVVYHNFPFMLEIASKDKQTREDIKQIAWLCTYSTDDFRSWWNMAQREIYALVVSMGFRKRKNKWIRIERIAI